MPCGFPVHDPANEDVGAVRIEDSLCAAHLVDRLLKLVGVRSFHSGESAPAGAEAAALALSSGYPAPLRQHRELVS